MKKRIQVLCLESKNIDFSKLKEKLSSAGFDIIVADCISNFFNLAERCLADVILTDFSISYIQAVSLLKQIRSNKATRYNPVMAVMPKQENTDAKFIDIGYDDFIRIPFELDDLSSRLKLLARLNYYRRQLSAKEQFETIVSQMSEGIVICDLDWTLQRVNTCAKKHLNLISVIRSNIADYIYDNYCISIEKDELLDSRKPILNFEITRNETSKTKNLILEVTRNIITGFDGQANGILLTLRDVTEKRKEESLKQNFLSFISHKLKTPLTVLFARCDLLRSGIYGQLNPKQLNELNCLMAEIRNLRILFNKLLNFVEHQKDTSEVIYIRNFLDTFFRHFVNTYCKNKIEIKTDIENNDLSVKISKRKLNDIFENLADNAIKFNTKDRVLITVSAAKSSNDFVNISFSDNGCGIPSEEYDKIFDKFYQVEKTFTGEAKGMGIGLSHVKEIIEQHGGNIKVDSTIDKGTTFMFQLPCD